MKTRKRAREEEAHLTPLQELWQAVREEDAGKLRRVLRERREALKGELDTTDPTTEYHLTALIMCILRDFRAGVKLLLSEGASIDATTGLGGFTPLFLASDEGLVKLVRILLSYGASIDLAANDGATPIYVAAQNNHPEIVSLLLEEGADANMAASDGATPLFAAAQHNLPDIVSLLLEEGVDASVAMNVDGCTPLIIAATQGYPDVVSLLIAHEVQLDLVENEGRNALHAAAFADYPEVCAMLIAAGLDPAAPNIDGWTSLSHYGHYLCNNEPGDWDGVDDATRPRLSDDEKRDRRALLVAVRDAFLLQKKSEENWQRRAPLMHALVGSGLRLTAAQKAEHAAFQAAMDYAAPIAPVPVDRLRDIFGNEGFVRTITEHI